MRQSKIKDYMSQLENQKLKFNYNNKLLILESLKYKKETNNTDDILDFLNV